jgi:hypothetical protein
VLVVVAVVLGVLVAIVEVIEVVVVLHGLMTALSCVLVVSDAVFGVRLGFCHGVLLVGDVDEMLLVNPKYAPIAMRSCESFSSVTSVVAIMELLRECGPDCTNQHVRREALEQLEP